ncbi:MAG TPA: thioredoxin-disulfide reductase [Dehalococcoidales bacterium]|nr:thioredoxin-disulfide reductase [Dehalococcoidales bacterium]
MSNHYELIILGGGPAGLSAGLYAARNKTETLMIEKSMIGGLAVYADVIENYPGFPDGISGMELAQLMLTQAEKFGLKTLMAEIQELRLAGNTKTVRTSEGEFSARAVIIAMGSERINLNVPGEKEYVGRGVSYCATCDAAFYREKEVVVVGGGNSAISEALHLAKFASRVSVIHRRDKWRATPVFVDKARNEPKMNFIMNTTVEAIEGGEFVEKLKLKNVLNGSLSEHRLDGIFVAVGQSPNTQLLEGTLPLDSGGYIKTNEKMETSWPGVLAAGDIRSNSIRQTITAAGDGATAAIYADRFISGLG